METLTTLVFSIDKTVPEDPKVVLESESEEEIKPTSIPDEEG